MRRTERWREGSVVGKGLDIEGYEVKSMVRERHLIERGREGPGGDNSCHFRYTMPKIASLASL